MVSRFDNDSLKESAEAKYKILANKLSNAHSVEAQAALQALRIRLLSLMSHKYSVELFKLELLNLNDLDRADTLEKATDLVDQYTAIANFYDANYKTFSWMAKERFFIDHMKGGNLEAWNALLSRTISYKNLNSAQSTTFVLQVLAGVPARKVAKDVAAPAMPFQSEKVTRVSSSHLGAAAASCDKYRPRVSCELEHETNKPLSSALKIK
ncbi:hypothetical protein AQUSIP_23590 [Aquicella siphonis]|uniref:Uncharacterized protein n=1 Tax=Aquicella siphonis TaxID=254247 RepID=A0A5E4PL92_9COXI|nr:hypothetical protein [Aquicella siphonis]VVC77032.1 hypothetical protein AQUSIP_23590 [Aquicella siphonis]